MALTEEARGKRDARKEKAAKLLAQATKQTDSMQKLSQRCDDAEFNYAGRRIRAAIDEMETVKQELAKRT